MSFKNCIAKLSATVKKSDIIAVLLLFSVVAFVFWPEPNKEFLLWDDEDTLSQYKPLRPVTWSSLPELVTSTHRGEHMPLTRIFWALTVIPMQIVGGSKWATDNWVQPFVFVSVLVHFLNCLLIKKLFTVLFRQESEEKKWQDWIPVFLYALHPLQVEALASVPMLREPLWIFWGLLSILFYLKNRLRVSLLMFLLAVFSKPTAITTAGIIFVLHITRNGTKNLFKKPTRNYFLALFGLCLPIAILAKSVQPTEDFTTTYWQRIIYSMDTYGFYLSKMILPINLSADYGRTYSWLIPQGWTKEIFVFLFFIFSLIFLFWKRPQSRTPILILASILVLPLTPVSGLIPFAMQHYSNVADHYAAFSLVAWAGLFFAMRTSNKKINAALIAALVFYSWQSVQYRKTWINNETFAMHTLEINPRSFMAYNNLGLHWLRQGKKEEALNLFSQSIELNPKVINAYLNSVVILNEQKRYDESLAILKRCEESCHKGATIPLAIANVYEEQGRKDEALNIYIKAKEDYPTNAKVRYELGMAYWGRDQFTEAISELKEATQLEPENEQYMRVLKQSELLYEQVKKVNNL